MSTCPELIGLMPTFVPRPYSARRSRFRIVGRSRFSRPVVLRKASVNTSNRSASLRRGSYDDVVLGWNALGEGAGQDEQWQDGGQADFGDDIKGRS